MQRQKLDMVAVFSPQRNDLNKMRWDVKFFTNHDELASSFSHGLSLIKDQLPSPRLEGYQVREWQRGGYFDFRSQGLYLADQYQMSAKDGWRMTAKISMRAPHESPHFPWTHNGLI